MKNNGGLAVLAQTLIEYVEDLITESPKDAFTKLDILILLNAVKNDPVLLHMFNSHELRPAGEIAPLE